MHFQFESSPSHTPQGLRLCRKMSDLTSPLASFLGERLSCNAMQVTIVEDNARARISAEAQQALLRSSNRKSKTVASRWESSPSHETGKRLGGEATGANANPNKRSVMPLRRPTRRHSTESVDKGTSVVAKSRPRMPSRTVSPTAPSQAMIANDIMCFNTSRGSTRPASVRSTAA